MERSHPLDRLGAKLRYVHYHAAVVGERERLGPGAVLRLQEIKFADRFAVDLAATLFSSITRQKALWNFSRSARSFRSARGSCPSFGDRDGPAAATGLLRRRSSGATGPFLTAASSQVLTWGGCSWFSVAAVLFITSLRLPNSNL